MGYRETIDIAFKNLKTKDGKPWRGVGTAYRASGACASSNLLLESQLANWSTPRVHVPGENIEKLRTKDGKPWQGVGPAYRVSGARASSNLLLESQLENWKSPLASDYRRRGPGSKQQGLPNQVLEDK